MQIGSAVPKIPAFLDDFFFPDGCADMSPYAFGREDPPKATYVEVEWTKKRIRSANEHFQSAKEYVVFQLGPRIQGAAGDIYQAAVTNPIRRVYTMTQNTLF